MTDLERRLASLERQAGYLMDVAAEAQKFAEKQVKINAALAARLETQEQRLAELERGSQLVAGETGEWVHRDGCLVYDLDVTESHK